VQFDLNALIEDCLNIFRAKAEQQNIELISFTQPQVPRVISGDPTRLRQALSSLLENALKNRRRARSCWCGARPARRGAAPAHCRAGQRRAAGAGPERPAAGRTAQPLPQQQPLGGHLGWSSPSS
jgi:hypothetical protein